jgi:hypothetical protein
MGSSKELLNSILSDVTECMTIIDGENQNNSEKLEDVYDVLAKIGMDVEDAQLRESM